MQIKKGFKLRRIDDLFVVIAGAAARNFHGMITLNESGAFLWEKLTSAITVDELVRNTESTEKLHKRTWKSF